jgi:hypothetical protein
MEITLQKMEMPKQTRHRKLKVLEMSNEVCAILITVLLVTVQFEILFLSSFIKMHNFVLLFFFAMVLAHRTLLCFVEKEHVSLIECFHSWINVRENIFSC